MEGDREKIMDKRSSLRSWRERAPRRPRQNELLGIALVGAIFIAIIASAFIGGGEKATVGVEKTRIKEEVKEPGEKPKEKGEIQMQAKPVSIPAPTIRIDSPANITYNTSTPPLNFIVAGSGLDSVLLSVDGGPNIAIPHDGTLAKVDSGNLDLLFWDDFSGVTPFKLFGISVMDGRLTGSGRAELSGSFSDFVLEAKARLIKGNYIAFDFRWRGKDFYRVQTHDSFQNLYLYKFTKEGRYLLKKEPLGVEPDAWHIWKIVAEENQVEIYIDGAKYLWFRDEDKPHLNGGVRFLTGGNIGSLEDIRIYQPLPDGSHNLTISANNTAGNTSTIAVFFTVNTAKAEEKIGGMGETISKAGFEVTLKDFEIYKDVRIYLNAQKTVYEVKSQSVVTLQVKNVGEKEKPLKLDPSAVLLDDQGRQYGMRVYRFGISGGNQIEQTTIYPGVTREGVILFDPVSLSAKNLTLYLYINNVKYEFAFNPFD
jgi:hypothetical protein